MGHLLDNTLPRYHVQQSSQAYYIRSICAPRITSCLASGIKQPTPNLPPNSTNFLPPSTESKAAQRMNKKANGGNLSCADTQHCTYIDQPLLCLSICPSSPSSSSSPSPTPRSSLRSPSAQVHTHALHSPPPSQTRSFSTHNTHARTSTRDKPTPASKPAQTPLSCLGKMDGLGIQDRVGVLADAWFFV